jgi:hypothetical protein
MGKHTMKTLPYQIKAPIATGVPHTIFTDGSSLLLVQMSQVIELTTKGVEEARYSGT